MNMSYMLTCMVLNIPAMISLGIGGYLCATGKEGWGWFLFAAVLFARFPDAMPK